MSEILGLLRNEISDQKTDIPEITFENQKILKKNFDFEKIKFPTLILFQQSESNFDDIENAFDILEMISDVPKQQKSLRMVPKSDQTGEIFRKKLPKIITEFLTKHGEIEEN